MKKLSQLLMALLLACALSAGAVPVRSHSHKSYEEMTPEEIRAEVNRLEQELLRQGSRLAGIPLTNDQAADKSSTSSKETPPQAKPSEEAVNTEKSPSEPVTTDETIQRKKPARHLRRNRQDVLVKAEAPHEEPAQKISMHPLIKNGAARLEREKQRSGQAAPTVVKLNPSPKSEEPEFVMGDDGKREIELELPLPSGNGKHQKKEKVKVKIKPEVMTLHRQIQGLNQMLIDDVVRMTGKPLQKKKQTVRRK